MKLGKVVGFLLLLGLYTFTSSSAQTTGSVNWSLSAVDSQHVTYAAGNLIGLDQSSSPGFVVRDYANGPGPDQRWWPHDGTSEISWGDETTQNDNRWVQFAVYPESNFQFQAEELNIYIGAKGTNGIRANVRMATDTSFSESVLLNDSELELLKDTDSLYTFTLNKEIKTGGVLYIRIYPWYTGSPSTSKYLYLREATISGTTSEMTYPASAQWELTDPGTGGTGLTAAVSGNVKAEDERLNNMEINQYTGPETSQRIRIAGNAWPANQTDQIDSVYVEFAVSPKSGFNFNVTSLSFGIAAASTDYMKANVYYSSDPEFLNPIMVDYTTADTANNYLPRDVLAVVSAEPNLQVNSGETFYLRIYPWVDGESSIKTGKYVTLKNVVIGGEIQGNPSLAEVLYPFVDNESAVVTGALAAEDQAYNDKMKFYGFTDLQDMGSGDHHVGAIQTTSKEWYAEPNPTDSLYFQYEITPKYGATFFTEKFSMFIGGWFSSNLKAEIRYSKDPAFATSNVLIPDFALVGNAVDKVEADFNETVNTGESLYIRVYPHNTQAEGWAKLVAVDSVIVMGSTSGVTADSPTVITADIYDISTIFASGGGNVPSDGGSPVTSRGVCWNTSGSPTIDDAKSEDGSGSGSFESMLTGLTASTMYYVRAYAVNNAGVGYGEEITFSTLDSLGVPTVETSSVSNILVQSAEGGGNVIAWGGDTVSVRGICWNTTGSPTIADNKTEDGSGLGEFKSLLYPLDENTEYYVRAYATNSIGTGYGQETSFTSATKSADVMVVVAKDGSGDYTTVQAAFDAVPANYTGEYRIFVKKGVYYEKLFLDREKINVVLEGEDRDSTILTYDDYAGIAGGTSMSYSTAIDPNDFTAMNITFQNTVKNDGSVGDQQGVALRVNGDRQAYYNCNLLGYQDTYYTWGGRGTGRIYMKNCYIEGSVDFIFGRDIVLFDSCAININRDGGTLTAAATQAAAKFGYVFKDCQLTADSVGFDGDPITKFYLGRPWQDAPQTVFINCYEPATLDPAGWLNWNVPPGLYAEFQCYGEGSDYSNRNQISVQLTEAEAAEYTMENIFAKSAHPDYAYNWMPVMPTITGVDDNKEEAVIPKIFKLYQNYPNPFNPSTTINYDLPKNSVVRISIYNILGEQVAVLVNSQQAAGRYSLQFDAARYSSGIYFYNIQAGDFVQTKKMLLLK